MDNDMQIPFSNGNSFSMLQKGIDFVSQYSKIINQLNKETVKYLETNTGVIQSINNLETAIFKLSETTNKFKEDIGKSDTFKNVLEYYEETKNAISKPFEIVGKANDYRKNFSKTQETALDIFSRSYSAYMEMRTAPTTGGKIAGVYDSLFNKPALEYKSAGELLKSFSKPQSKTDMKKTEQQPRSENLTLNNKFGNIEQMTKGLTKAKETIKEMSAAFKNIGTELMTKSLTKAKETIEKMSGTFKNFGGILTSAFKIPMIIGIVGAITLLALAAYLIYKNWGTIKAFFINTWNGVKNTFNQFWTWIKGFVTNWGPIIMTIIAPFLGIPLLIFKNWENIKTWFSDLWSSIEKGFTDFVNGALQWGGNLVENIIKGLSTTKLGHGVLSFLGIDIKNNDPPARAIGISRVPYDNFPVLLHEGESVLTKRETTNRNNSLSGVSIAKLSDTIIVRKESDIDKIALALVERIRKTALNMA
jgi:hypothetical protein